MASKGLKSFHAWIPADLHDMLKKLSTDIDTSAKDIFVQYLRYLQKKHYKERKILNEDSEEEFDIIKDNT
jgi:hypothetical protein